MHLLKVRFINSAGQAPESPFSSSASYRTNSRRNRSQARPQKLSKGGSPLAPFGKKTGTIARHRFAIHNKKAAMPFDITACACVVELNRIEPMAHAHSSNSSGSRSNMGTFSSPESQLALFAMKIWPSGLIGTSLSRLPAGTTRSAPSI